jgi:hypothetical protein
MTASIESSDLAYLEAETNLQAWEAKTLILTPYEVRFTAISPCFT